MENPMCYVSLVSVINWLTDELRNPNKHTTQYIDEYIVYK